MKNKNMSFSFSFFTKETILNELRKLNPKKACQENDIPFKIIKENLDIVSQFVYNNFNNSLLNSNFPSHLKNTTITLIFKKKDRDNVENYRPVSILPNLSKIYERCMYIQIYEYLNKILSKWQCGFRQGYSAQYCLLVMVEKSRQCLDNGGVSGALRTYLLNTFDCILHDLLIAKLATYGFDYNSLQMLQSYLSNRKQRTKINDAYSKYCQILFGVPQGSILGPLLFNIYICDLFYDINDCDIATCADDNTPYASSSNLDASINKLEENTNNLFQWFRNNHMKTNADKYHLLVTGNYEVSANINEFEIESSKKEKFLGISIDATLSFEHHITSLCKKASQKLHALARIAHYIDFEKRRSLMKALVIFQFNYCSLIWMFHNRALNNRINKIHERALRLVYQNKNLSFSELLELYTRETCRFLQHKFLK